MENDDGEISFNLASIAKSLELDMEPLDVFIANFNDIFGDINWEDGDNVATQIKEFPSMVVKDKRMINAIENSDEENIKIKYENILADVMRAIMKDNMEYLLLINSSKSGYLIRFLKR